MPYFYSAPPRTKRLVFSPSAAAAWPSHFSCALRKSPASRGPPNKSFANILIARQLSLPAISASTCGSWRAGTTAIPAKARFSSAKKTGPIVGFFGPALGSWLRRQAQRQNLKRRDRQQTLKECHDGIRHQRRNDAVRTEICGTRLRGTFSRIAAARALFHRNRDVPRPTGYEDRRRLRGRDRRGGGERHQRDRCRDQLQVSAQRAQHRRGNPAACREGVRTRRNHPVH